MTEQELLRSLVVWRLPGIGNKRFFKLLDLNQKLDYWLQTPSRLIEAIKYACGINLNLKITQKQLDNFFRDAEADLRWAQGKSEKNYLITWADSNYPYLLKQIYDYPPILFASGQIEILKNIFNISIVGTRNPTTYGINATNYFIKKLASYHLNLNIISGLALGIDEIAHKAAIASKIPTIAVVAHGLDQIYPLANKTLFSQIKQTGLIVSEFPLGIKARPAHFPRRNRIISGMSKGVLVVEAGENSGSLITAKLAATQGRDIFVVPGTIFNSSAIGCHKLIQEGAKLVQGPEDMLEEWGLKNSLLNIQDKLASYIDKLNLDTDLLAIYKLIAQGITTEEAIQKNLGLNTKEVSYKLFSLEMKNLIEASCGGYTIKCQKI